MDSFSKAIWPILQLLKIFGLDLDQYVVQEGGFPTDNRQLLLPIVRQFYSAVCLLVNIGWHSYSIVAFDIVGCHLSMFFLANIGFRELKSALSQLERVINHDARHFQRLRRHSWIAVIAILCFVTVQTSLSIYRYSSINLGLNGMLSLMSMDFGIVYPMTSYALFFVLAMSLASTFQHIDLMLAGHLRHSRRVSKTAKGVTMLSEIRSIHGLVCQTVHRLNESFQTLSLIHVVFAFTAVVNTSFMLIITPQFNINIFFYTIEVFTRLWILGYVGDRIQIEAAACLTTLANRQEIHFDPVVHSLMHQQQHVMLAAQVFQTIPKFDIYGLFQLSRQLVPTLIAAMITYSVILYQFKSG